MEFFLAGQWQNRDERMEVLNPGSGEVLDSVPIASAQDVETAMQTAVAGAKVMADLGGYARFEFLRKAADLMRQRREALAKLLSSEEGKPISESLVEVDRAVQCIELSGEEAKRLGGEVLPLDGGQGVKNKLGFTLRVPCGVVAAITPFNFPLNLVCHKVGPALAAGNALILKPASDTPLIALELVKVLLDAGLPPMAISCLTGQGSMLGNAICTDARVRKISFTGSYEVGKQISHAAGIKRVTMELGANSPLIVLEDADLEKAVTHCRISGFANAGQVCISAQRIIVAEGIYDQFLERLIPAVEAIQSGDQLQKETELGPMVREGDARRVEQWIEEAEQAGATIACGGGRSSAFMEPTVVCDAQPEMRIMQEELFGPGVAVCRVAGAQRALELANSSNYGLSAGVFTQDVDQAMQFARGLDSGNIHINWGPMWRTDLIPYGGLKDSGLGKEGPKYAVEEMTEMKTVVIHS